MILNIYKPSGPSSHDIVDKVREITGEGKVGHGGTLDPFAEGVLVVGVTREGTKQLGKFSTDTDKEYVATLKLGYESETLDPEGQLQRIANSQERIEKIAVDDILKTIKRFEGEIEQVPPKYSAVKVDGVPAYKRARRGEEFELPPRRVTIKNIELYNTDQYGLQRIDADEMKHLGWDCPYLAIKVVCGSGTYIRALARDIGEELGVGAYLVQLIRTRVGSYALEGALTLEELSEEVRSKE